MCIIFWSQLIPSTVIHIPLSLFQLLFPCLLSHFQTPLHPTLQELLSQLHHYSATVKHGALSGLRELLTSHPALVEQHLSTLLSEVAAAFTDKDGSVRSAALRLLRFVAQCVSSERVGPFFPLLSAHLTCAMTHIQAGIQADAMLVLDVLLEHYPALLAHRHAHLLTNFLELISRQRLTSGAKAGEKGGVGKVGWALTVTPDRSVTAQQWRLTVLLRCVCVCVLYMKRE